MKKIALFVLFIVILPFSICWAKDWKLYYTEGDVEFYYKPVKKIDKDIIEVKRRTVLTGGTTVITHERINCRTGEWYHISTEIFGLRSVKRPGSQKWHRPDPEDEGRQELMKVVCGDKPKPFRGKAPSTLKEERLKAFDNLLSSGPWKHIYAGAYLEPAVSAKKLTIFVSDRWHNLSKDKREAFARECFRNFSKLFEVLEEKPEDYRIEYQHALSNRVVATWDPLRGFRARR